MAAPIAGSGWTAVSSVALGRARARASPLGYRVKDSTTPRSQMA
jgi:hypothetical protein